MDNLIPTLHQFTTNWVDIFNELDTPEEKRGDVIEYFMRREANTPYQLLGWILLTAYPVHEGGVDRKGMDDLYVRYMGRDIQDTALVREIRRALFYVLSVGNDLFHLNLEWSFTHGDGFFNFSDFEAHLYTLEPETGVYGGNKKKKSAKRKSSKKRSTRSKKRVSSV